MIATPRTDAMELDDSHFDEGCSGPSGYVTVRDCRQLETELAQAKTALAAVTAERDALRGEYKSP